MILNTILFLISLLIIASGCTWLGSSYYSIKLAYEKYKDRAVGVSWEEHLTKILKELVFDIAICILSFWAITELIFKCKDINYVIGSYLFGIAIAKSIGWLLLGVVIYLLIRAGLFAYKASFILEARYNEYIEGKSESIYKGSKYFGNTAKG